MTSGADLHESTHGSRVLQFIRERINAAGGWLPFDEYMQLVLYAPGLGYYSAGAHKLGRGGDFTTAPEMSPLFGQCLAQHCVEVLAATGGGDVLEIGAGSGRLACDVLMAMQRLGVPPGRYRILEISADLRARQQAQIAQLPADIAQRVEWLDAPPQQPWQGAVLANEVLDALPVECFVWRDGELFARGVALARDGTCTWQDRPAPPALREEVARLRADAGAQWPALYHSELCQRVAPWLTGVTENLTRGVALLIDYGLPRRDYYRGERSDGTLRCHWQQRAHDDPFAHPGLEDITAWVDFTRVAEGADLAGLEVLGFATQAAVLLALGIENHVAAAAAGREQVTRAGEARRLLMPEEMGENFKVIALGRGWEAPLSGFRLQDLRSRL